MRFSFYFHVAISTTWLNEDQISGALGDPLRKKFHWQPHRAPSCRYSRWRGKKDLRIKELLCEFNSLGKFCLTCCPILMNFEKIRVGSFSESLCYDDRAGEIRLEKENVVHSLWRFEFVKLFQGLECMGFALHVRLGLLRELLICCAFQFL